MTTTISSTPLALDKKGDLYICSTGSGSVISTNPEELVEAVRSVEAKNLVDFIGADVATWTFVETDTAANYDGLKDLLKGILPQSHRGTPNGPSLLTHFLNQYSKEHKDAAEWIANNAHHPVKSISSVSGLKHYFMFADRDEALLFKLTLTA